MIKINRLVSGGIITNYDCSSKCKHCVYASSPSWPKDYMTKEKADEVFKMLKDLGCHSVHIGGGEPLLRPDDIFPVLEAAKRHHMSIEYIETNASWFKDEATAELLLNKLIMYHVHTLLISIDPFHNEYIPFQKVKGLIKVCQKANMGVFPWLMEFWPDLDAMDDTIPHALEAYAALYGQDYVSNLPKRYGLNLRGRALQTFKATMKMETVEKMMDASVPCRLLSGTHHFHVDVYGNFIPQTCPGLAIQLKDLAQGVDPKKYRILDTLDSVGIKGLLNMAIEQYHYKPKLEYAGKCDLCFDIRRFLVMDLGLDAPDLQPTGHYKFM